MFNRILFAVYIISNLCLPNAFGQACCSGGVPLSGNLGLNSSETGTLQVQATYDYNTLRDLFFEDELLNDRRRIRNTHSIILEGSYDFSLRFSLSFLGSLVRQERIILTQTGGEDFTANQGLGDGVLLLRYNLIKREANRPSQFIIGAGPKFPFGRADFTDARGILLPADLQPGTGAWDLMFWGNYSYNGLFTRKNLSFSLISTTRLTTTNQRYGGRQAYKFGNEFQFQAGLQDRFVIGSLLIDPLLIVNYRWVGPDLVDGFTFDNTGGHWIYLRPGVNLNLGPESAIRLTGDLPIYRQLEGTQLTTSYRIALTFYRSISLKKKPLFNPINHTK